MRDEKQLLLDEIKNKIELSTGFIALGYKAFHASRVREFRNKIAEAGGEFEGVRKRVFVKAAQVKGISFEVGALEGHVGVVFAQHDVALLAKEVVEFGKKHDASTTILGGYIDGVVYSAQDMITLAELPSLPQMRAQILGLFEAPMAQTLQILCALLAGPLYCIDQKITKDQAQSE